MKNFQFRSLFSHEIFNFKFKNFKKIQNIFKLSSDWAQLENKLFYILYIYKGVLTQINKHKSSKGCLENFYILKITPFFLFFSSFKTWKKIIS